MRILVDTNVFLDLLLKREPYFEDGVRFIEHCKANRNELYINAMSFRDIEYVLRKQINDKNLIKDIMNKIYCLITKIIPITPDDAIEAIFNPGKDFEDTLIANSAERAMLDCIVTSNPKHFVDSKIRAFSLKEINKAFEKNYK